MSAPRPGRAIFALPARGLVLGQTNLAIVAASAGLGAALVPERIAATALAAGRLVIVGAGRLDMPWDYVLVWPEARGRRAALQALIAHLRGGL